MRLLEMNHIKKSFDGQEVLKDISIHVDEGEVLSIIGPSGSGKSTLLNIIGGIESYDKGEIIINGAAMSAMNEKQMTLYRREHLGYVFQFYNLIPNLTVKENIEVGAYLGSNPLDVDDLLHTLGLWEHKDKIPSQLSGGMRQRAALIRTLVLRPELLLLDEPFSALDYQTRLNVSNDIGTILQQEHKTAILVTHDLSEAISMGDRVIVLSHRPGTIRSIIPISFEPGLTPLEKRNDSHFKSYFNLIWKEFNQNE